MKRCTRCIPLPCPLRINTYEAMYLPALLRYSRPILLQLEAGPEPHPEDADGSVVPAEGSRLGNATLQAPKRRCSLSSKLTFGPATSSYLTTAFFPTFMSRQRDTKSNIIGVRRDLRPRTSSKRDTTQGQNMLPHPRAYRTEATKWGHRKKKVQGKPCWTDRLIAKATEHFLFTYTTVWVR